MSFTRDPKVDILKHSACYVVGVIGRQVQMDGFSLPQVSPQSVLPAAVPIGMLRDSPVVAQRVMGSECDQVDGLSLIDLRDVLASCPDDVIEAVLLGVQRLEFTESHLFCAVCSGSMSELGDTGKSCVQCHHTVYPHVTPAVLVLIEDDKRRVLLAQKSTWGDRYSVIAGFVEPGESLEACCMREALEEVGFVVENPRYVASQAWPFPHQLMVAFRVQWKSGDIVLDMDELSDAQWFCEDNLPELPPEIALSRGLIEHWRTTPTIQ